MRASLKPPNSTAFSIVRRRRRLSKCGGSRLETTSSSPGKLRNSSRTGSVCPTARRTVSNCRKVGFLCSATEANADRLASFFKLLSSKRHYSLEFRHPSWYQPRILRMLADENISLCLSDHHDAPAPWMRTADFVYVCGHGPGGRYRSRYPRPVLAQWAQRIKSWGRQGCDVYVYFDDDQDALKLRALL